MISASNIIKPIYYILFIERFFFLFDWLSALSSTIELSYIYIFNSTDNVNIHELFRTASTIILQSYNHRGDTNTVGAVLEVFLRRSTKVYMNTGTYIIRISCTTHTHTNIIIMCTRTHTDEYLSACVSIGLNNALVTRKTRETGKPRKTKSRRRGDFSMCIIYNDKLHNEKTVYFRVFVSFSLRCRSKKKNSSLTCTHDYKINYEIIFYYSTRHDPIRIQKRIFSL